MEQYSLGKKQVQIMERVETIVYLKQTKIQENVDMWSGTKNVDMWSNPPPDQPKPPQFRPNRQKSILAKVGLIRNYQRIGLSSRVEDFPIRARISQKDSLH